MIGRLTGDIHIIDSENIMIDIGGIGYNVSVPSSVISSIEANKKRSFWIYTQVKENEITLFGFETKEQRQVFETLIKVQGVGGKLALAILSVISLNSIVSAIAAGDSAAFRKVSGVGPKLAARIVNELSDPKTLRNHLESKLSANINTENNFAFDGASVLANLGFSKTESFKTTSMILDQDPQISLEELIKKSLAVMSNK